MGSDDNHVSRFSLLCICSVAICLLMVIAGGTCKSWVEKYERLSANVV